MDQEKSEREMHKFYKKFGNEGYEYMADKVFEFMRLVSGPLAVHMLRQIGLDENTNAPFELLDNGAGSGIVGAEVQSRISPTILAQSKIVSADFAENMVEIVKQRIVEQNWVNTESRVIDAQDMQLPSASFTHVTANITFHVIPDSEAALKECLRVLKPGGMLGFTTWHKGGIGWAEGVRDAFASFPFEASCSMKMQTTKWGDWSDVNWIKKTLHDQGLEDVKVDVLSHLQPIESAAQFVNNYSSMLEWLINARWSEELKKEHGLDEVKKLVEDYLGEKYGGKGWDLTWTSIIASGRKPLE